MFWESVTVKSRFEFFFFLETLSPSSFLKRENSGNIEPRHLPFSFVFASVASVAPSMGGRFKFARNRWAFNSRSSKSQLEWKCVGLQGDSLKLRFLFSRRQWQRCQTTVKKGGTFLNVIKWHHIWNNDSSSPPHQTCGHSLRNYCHAPLGPSTSPIQGRKKRCRNLIG